jgi:outer membrane protein
MIGSKVWLVAAVVAAGLVSVGAEAQATLKIGVINLGRVVEASPQFAAAQKKLDEEFGPRQRDLQATAQKLRGVQRTTLERQLRDGQRDLERTNNEVVEDFNLRRNEVIGQLQREVIGKAQQYAREQKFDLLLADQTVVFASTAVDITDAVIAMLKPAAAAAPARPQ